MMPRNASLSDSLQKFVNQFHFFSSIPRSFQYNVSLIKGPPFGPVLDNDLQTSLPPQKEPTIRFFKHTFQIILRRTKKIYTDNFFLEICKKFLKCWKFLQRFFCQNLKENFEYTFQTILRQIFFNYIFLKKMFKYFFGKHFREKFFFLQKFFFVRSLFHCPIHILILG